MSINPCKRNLVITLVHGTWATKAKWIRTDSLLRNSLSAQLGPEVVFIPFKWSGQNSHRARLAAARLLEAQILKTRSQFPQSCHIVVAHSHGGNVALYALRNPDVAASISGLVTLATPFITVASRPSVKRALQMVTAALNICTFGCAAIVIFGLLLQLLMFVDLSIFHGGKGIILTLLCCALGMRLLTLISGMSSRFTAIVREPLRTWALSKQQCIIDRLSVTACETVPMLSLKFSFDEARFLLQLTRFFAESVPRVVQPLCALSLGSFLFGLSTFLWIAVVDLIRFFGCSALPSFDVALPATVYLFMSSLVFFIMYQILTTISSVTIYSGGFGPESPLSALLVLLSETEALIGTNVDQRKYGIEDILMAFRKGGALRSFLHPGAIHSLAYSYPVAINELAQWISYVRCDTSHFAMS